MQLSELNKGLIFTGLFKFIDIFISFFFILEGYVKRLVTLFFFLGFLFFFVVKLVMWGAIRERDLRSVIPFYFPSHVSLGRRRD
ncbi:unnamed protein product [Brassica oleracea var. botrytis]